MYPSTIQNVDVKTEGTDRRLEILKSVTPDQKLCAKFTWGRLEDQRWHEN